MKFTSEIHVKICQLSSRVGHVYRPQSSGCTTCVTHGSELGSNVIIGILTLARVASASLPLLVGCSEMWPQLLMPGTVHSGG